VIPGEDNADGDFGGACGSAHRNGIAVKTARGFLDEGRSGCLLFHILMVPVPSARAAWSRSLARTCSATAMQECIWRETPILGPAAQSSARFCYGCRVRCVSENDGMGVRMKVTPKTARNCWRPQKQNLNTVNNGIIVAWLTM
jgi:hypothetical protein